MDTRKTCQASQHQSRAETRRAVWRCPGPSAGEGSLSCAASWLLLYFTANVRVEKGLLNFVLFSSAGEGMVDGWTVVIVRRRRSHVALAHMRIEVQRPRSAALILYSQRRRGRPSCATPAHDAHIASCPVRIAQLISPQCMHCANAVRTRPDFELSTGALKANRRKCPHPTSD
ncbi:hypothetical protein FA95DRAFT_997894 [Auriscalpium vulgare]|uniref:Uncharacterized protein n=1 Tax=Auriscalpium vulgare TaxID=40419 RepID=A0ACB8RYY1_9AGAM|nr:hypothetical protein FA95DRAFT_997894 [Auriscalpium vulgare]